MATVLHIDGPGIGQRFGTFSIGAGESTHDVVGRLGVTIRTERVPDPRRKLSPQAAEFIRDYGYEEPDSVLAIYWRHHSLYAEEFGTVDDAARYLWGGEEYGEVAGEAIVNGDRITVW